MKTVFALAAIAVCGSVASAAVVTQWNFNSATNDANTATGTTLPFVGSGTASLVGGVTSPSYNAGGNTGIASALLATVAGLIVAIPALFIYSYLNSRIKETTSDMQVFIDEFVAKMAEFYPPVGKPLTRSQLRDQSDKPE